MTGLGLVALCCPSCSSSNVADLGGYAECRECGYGFVISIVTGRERLGLAVLQDLAAALDTASRYGARFHAEIDHIAWRESDV